MNHPPAAGQLPLDGITVVAVNRPSGALRHAPARHLGAGVIKIERPDGGDFARGYAPRPTGRPRTSTGEPWQGVLAVDLKDPRGIDIVRQLIADADVFVQNLAQGAACPARSGRGDLCAAHRRLSPWTSPGTRGRTVRVECAYDMLVQCEARLVSVTGTREHPVKAGIPPAHIAAAMYASRGACCPAAARHDGARRAGGDLDAGVTGRVDGASTALRDARRRSAGAHGVAHAVISPTTPIPRRTAGRSCCRYRTTGVAAAGRPGARACLSWPTDPVFATNTARTANRDETDGRWPGALGALDTEEALARLEAAGIACAGLETYDVAGIAARGVGPLARGGLTGRAAAGAAAADHPARRSRGSMGAVPHWAAHRRAAEEPWE